MTTATVWVLVGDFGRGPIAAGPFDTWADANAYDPDTDQLEARQISRADWDRHAATRDWS